MKALVAAAANNAHLCQIGLALSEADLLSRFVVPFAGWPLGHAVVGKTRVPADIPRDRVDHYPPWELVRLVAGRARLPARWIDLIWERGEHAYDAHCASLVASSRPGAYLGVEHAALGSLRAARSVQAGAGLVFPSLHHAFRTRWLDPELDRFPELLTPDDRLLRKRATARDGRRDDEMGNADFIHANSRLTAASLVDAGFRSDRILTVPLGCPPAVDEEELLKRPLAPPSVLFVGNIAVHKGAHHLLEAWRAAPRPAEAVLHLYGTWALPQRLRPSPSDSVVVHGRVGRAEVRAAMRSATVLVLPSICDGFGMVVSEAMAEGLPVICSTNAGAAQMVEQDRNGFIVPAAQPEFLAARIGWCLAHPENLAAMRIEAARTAREWSWRHFREAFVSGLLLMSTRVGFNLRSDRP